jgi:hypothetical protein
MAGRTAAPGLGGQLDDWIAQGLIDAGQAARIRAAQEARAVEAAQPGPPDGGVARPVPGGASRRLPLVVEALGYLGAVFAVAAGLIATRQLWRDVPAGAELAFAGVAASALQLVGAMLRTSTSPAFARLRSVLWLLSAACVAAFTGLLIGPGFWEMSPASGLLVTEAVVTVYAVTLWWWSRAALQYLAAFAALAALAGTSVGEAWPGLHTWGAGLAVWVLSLLCGLAAHRGLLAPRTAGFAAAGIGLLVGAQLTMILPAGQVLALATVAGLLTAGVAVRRVLLLGLGAVGALLILPQVADRYLAGGAAAAMAVFLVGLVMLGVAVWLARARANR